jgi:hypothetical protein
VVGDHALAGLLRERLHHDREGASAAAGDHDIIIAAEARKRFREDVGREKSIACEIAGFN